MKKYLKHVNEKIYIKLRVQLEQVKFNLNMSSEQLIRLFLLCLQVVNEKRGRSKTAAMLPFLSTSDAFIDLYGLVYCSSSKFIKVNLRWRRFHIHSRSQRQKGQNVCSPRELK